MEHLYIQRIKEGDVSCFSYFIEKYKGMAFSVAFRIVNNKEDAQEIVQDSFMKAYSSLGKFRNDSKFSTWLYRIVVNHSFSRIKKKNIVTSDVGLDNISENLIGYTESVYNTLAHNEQKRFINIALDEMNTEERLLLTLYYLNENSIEEITEITDISRENVKMKLHRSRKKMYMILNRLLKSDIQHI